MLRAVNLGLTIRREHGIAGVATEAQVRAVIAAAGYGFRDDRPYRGRVQGRFFRDHVLLRRGLWPGRRRVVMAHELGHGLLGHDGDAFYRHDPPFGDRILGPERSAQVFAWTLLVGLWPDAATDQDAQFRRAVEDGLPLDVCCQMLSLARTLTDVRTAATPFGLATAPPVTG